MAFADCLGISKINAVFIRRNAAYLNLAGVINNIEQLDRENLKTRQFLYLEKEAETLLETLKKENTLLIQAMMTQMSNVSSDSAFTADQESFRSTTFKAVSAMDSYRSLLEAANLVPSLAQQQQVAAHSSEMTELLKQLLKTQNALTEIGKKQTEVAKMQVDAITASKGPKPVQPIFSPKGNTSDYLEFRSFSSKFQYFTKDITDDKDKLQWLLSSVRHEAYESLKGLTLEASNFEVAWSKLEKKYLDNEYILRAIFSDIYLYKNTNPGKNYQNILKGITKLENHIAELLNVHKLDCHEGASDKLIAFIVFENLPGQLRNELINITKSTFPSLRQIFDNIKVAVDKVNISNGNTPIYPTDTSEGGKNSFDKNVKSSIGNVCVDYGDSGSESCSDDSASVSSESSCTSLEKDRNDNSAAVRSGSSGVNCFTHSPVLVDGAGALHRAVALETAVLSIKNQECQFLPLERRHFSILCDLGAQRSLITESCVRRLNLKVVRKELAGLQGLGQTSCTVVPYDVVEVVVGSPQGKHSVRFDALVVSSLNSIYMPGANRMARKLHSKGVVMADWRFLRHSSDTVISDCLLGADFYRRIVCARRLPHQHYGIWLSYTVFGTAMMSGKIPGSTRVAHSDSVNVLSILNVGSASKCVGDEICHNIHSGVSNGTAQCVAPFRRISSQVHDSYQPFSFVLLPPCVIFFTLLHMLYSFLNVLPNFISLFSLYLHLSGQQVLPFDQDCHKPGSLVQFRTSAFSWHLAGTCSIFLWIFLFLHLLKSGFYKLVKYCRSVSRVACILEGRGCFIIFIFDIVLSWIGHATAYDILTALFTDYSILYPDTLYTHIISYIWTILSFSCALLLIYEQV